MNRQEAMAAAGSFLAATYPAAPPTIVLREEWTQEHAWAWRVKFDTQEYLDSGDMRHRPMSCALYVRKDNGEVAYIPTAMSAAVSTQYLETGVWPYGPAATSTTPAATPTPQARA